MAKPPNPAAQFKLAKPPLALGASALYPDSPHLRNRLTTMSRFGDPLHLYQEAQGGKLRVARQLAPGSFDLADQDKRSDGGPLLVDFKLQLRPHQGPLVQQSLGLLEKGQDHVLQAGTGMGKTVMGLWLAWMLSRSTLVVVTKEDLLNRWVEEVGKCFGAAAAKDVGLIRGDVCNVKPLTVGMIHSLAKPDKYPPWVARAFGLVIYDECHRLPADTFQRTAFWLNSRHRLGLSATPQRVDGKEVVLHAHLGPIEVVGAATPMEPKVIRFRTGWSCPRYSNGARVAHSPGKAGHILKSMRHDGARNALIAECVSTLHLQRGRHIVVMSDLLDHLKAIRARLVAAGCNASDIAFYVGGMTEAARAKAAAKSILLATYQMMGEGTDIPWLDTCVLATPRSNIEQAVGRVLREYDGKPQPLVIDLMDLDSPVYHGYVSRRFQWYKSRGYTVVDG